MKKLLLFTIPLWLFLFSQTCFAATVVTVSFDANGGTATASSMAYTVGQPYGVLPSATKQGYVFNCWMDTSGNAISTASIVTGTTTLKASYTTGSYKIYFNGNGGNCSKQYGVVAAGSKLGSLPVPTRQGNYAFAGWSITQTSPYSYVSADTVMPANDITVYAIWVQTANTDSSNASTKTETIGDKVEATNTKTVGRLKFKFKRNLNATGYQVRFSRKKNMKNAQKRTITTNANIITITSSKIVPKKKYYVQVRAYKKKKNGKKVYGKWSAKKRFKATKVK